VGRTRRLGSKASVGRKAAYLHRMQIERSVHTHTAPVLASSAASGLCCRSGHGVYLYWAELKFSVGTSFTDRAEGVYRLTVINIRHNIRTMTTTFAPLNS
jgi:hypothetical protein